MLTSFGTFWGVEGAGGNWPGDDFALAVIIPVTLVVSVAMVAALRRAVPARAMSRAGVT